MLFAGGAGTEPERAVRSRRGYDASYLGAQALTKSADRVAAVEGLALPTPLERGRQHFTRRSTGGWWR
jgi:hypothetical protein